jgi:hypothetical protein
MTGEKEDTMMIRSTFKGICAALVVAGLAGLASLTAAPVHAQGAFAKEYSSDAEALGKVNLSMMNGNGDGADSGRGPVVYYKGLGGPPKRVALISFYVWDCGNTKVSSYHMYGGNYVYHVKNTRNRNVGADESVILASELYDAAIPGMKEAFAAHKMQLLEPGEYLDTAEKKAAYENFEMGQSSIVKFLSKGQKSKGDSTKYIGAPEEYRVFEMAVVNDVKGNHFTLGNTGVGVGKLAKSLGHDLTAALGVDAVVVVYNVIQREKKDIRMRGAYMYMFGPNPVKDTGQSLYWNGHQYSGHYLRMDVPFVVMDKDGKVESVDYDGYAVVAKALAAKTGERLDEKTTGAKQ